MMMTMMAKRLDIGDYDPARLPCAEEEEVGGGTAKAEGEEGGCGIGWALLP